METRGCHVVVLMEQRVAGLFRHDARGRMLSINQWDGGKPPRFYLGRTPGGSVCRIRSDVPESAARELLAVAATEPPLGEPGRTPANAAVYLSLLGLEGGQAEVGGGPVYHFGATPPPLAETVLISADKRTLLRGGLEDWLPDVPHRQPMVAVVVDGRAVSVCASVRITDSGHEAGVETLSEHRRRGYAAGAVAGWAAEVGRRGVPNRFYSTSWDNVASQRVAARLELTLIGADFTIG